MTHPLNLTPREFEVVNILCAVGSNKLIARQLGISVYTVSIMIHRACQKAGVNDRVTLALKWDRMMREPQ